MKNKLISSIIMLLMTCLLFIFSIFAWYSSNEEVSASDIVASTEGDSYNFELYQFINNEWIKVIEEISLDNLNPNDVIYFKMKIYAITDNPKPLSSYFNGIESIVSNDLVYKNDSITYDDIPLYSVINDAVVINEFTLYKINNNKIELDYYKIEDVMKLYTNLTSTSITDATANSINSLIFNDLTPTKTGTESIFALEFNNDSSIVSGYESNLYAYQSLFIQSIQVRS